MLIRNGRVHDGLGGVTCQDIRISDGVIQELGTALLPEDGEEVVEAAGMEILPGFIQTISSWGVNGSETEIRPSSQDNEEKSDPITPELDGFYAFNGRAVTMQQLGAFGITNVGVAPADVNLFSGMIAAFTVDGVNPYSMCLKRKAGMIASVTESLKKTYGMRKIAPMSRMWIFQKLEEQLRKAAEYKDPDQCGAESEEKDKGSADAAPPVQKDEKLKAIKEVTEGNMPLFAVCDSLPAILHVKEITGAYPKLKLVLVNGFGLTGEEEWIIEQNVPVVVRTAALPLDEAAMKLNLKAIADLYKKGALIALSGSAANMVYAREDLLWNCSEMMKHIPDAEKVLTMVTGNPARLLGIDEITGSIRKGMQADLVLWSKNPMETWDAHVVRTWSRGREIYREGDEMRCM